MDLLYIVVLLMEWSVYQWGVGRVGIIMVIYYRILYTQRIELNDRLWILNYWDIMYYIIYIYYRIVG